MMSGHGSDDKTVLISKRASNPRIEPEVELPNQIPVTSEIPKSSAVCNAAVKWKSKISVGQIHIEGDAGSKKEPGKPAPIKEEGGDPLRQTEASEKTPEVVITEAGSQTNLLLSIDGKGGAKTDKRPAASGAITDGGGDNLSQNSAWARQQQHNSRPGSQHGSRSGSLHGSRPGSVQGSRPSSRLSVTSRHSGSGRVASAILAVGTGTSFHELPNGVVGADGQTQNTRVGVDNPLLGALPSLPLGLAWVYLFLNILVPGLGTVMAGISLLCCGTKQQTIKQEDNFGMCCTNIVVGISQLFTVSFLLIGWIWSITWGVYLVIFAREHKRVKDAEMRLVRVTTAAKAFQAGRPM